MKRRNPVARAVRTPAFRQRVVQDKRKRVRAREARREIREYRGDCFAGRSDVLDILSVPGSGGKNGRAAKNTRWWSGPEKELPRGSAFPE